MITWEGGGGGGGVISITSKRISIKVSPTSSYLANI